MAKFYFIRHGQMDSTEANTKIYQGWGFNALTLSPLGISQIKKASEDARLKNSDLIISSPYGRTMHTAAILSKELNVDIAVETDLHEWVADKEYHYLSDDEAMKSFKEFTSKAGMRDDGCKYNWETAGDIVERTENVLKKYENLNKVIVVCHGTVMQYFLGIAHPENGQIEEYVHRKPVSSRLPVYIIT
ncbi:MAG: histidine phosphatase family protein [Catonella sp.]|nr:histidine phosphatase family protein [Catonella sp.]MDY6357107.1 histidine phosphatase family protein [Catonella sp.]